MTFLAFQARLGLLCCFEQKYEKYQSFLCENFQFLEVKFSIYLNRRVFVLYKLNVQVGT